MAKDTAVVVDNREARLEVPVYVAATSPFTLITFDEHDEPEFTLDEVNRKSYDNIKLCRTTLGLDPQHEAMEEMAAIMSYTGALLYPRMPGLTLDDVVSAANKLLLKLTFGGVVFDALAPADVGLGIIYHTGYFRAGGGADGPNYSRLMALQQLDAGSSDAMRLLHPRTFKASAISGALKIGSPIVEELPQLNPSILLNGLTYFKQYQLAPAMTFLWSSCETAIGRLWDDHVLPRGRDISGRKRFVDGNGWQAAHKVELLFQIGLIDEELYAELNKSRMSRNALAHRGETPTVDECKAVLNSVFRLLSLARSEGNQRDQFQDLSKQYACAHDPELERPQPKYWRPIQPIPGDTAWGDKEYPKHPEIELIDRRITKRT